MTNILPFIAILACTDGYRCDDPIRAEYPMPDWDICFQAAETMQISDAPETSEDRDFILSAICVGKNIEEK